LRSPIFSEARRRFIRRLRSAIVVGLCGIACAAVGSAAVSTARTPAGPARAVVLISLDGMRWDDPLSSRATNFARMRREGASAERLIPSFPPNTFPAHATLATGVHPDRHGILNNRFLDRERGLFEYDDDPSWLLAEPLWITAERQGARAAVYHWVGSSGPWRGISATYWEPFSSAIRDTAKVERIIEWLNLGGSSRPRLIMSYLHGVDSVSHREGPGSAAARRQIERIDRLVGRLLDALDRLERPMALVVVSDHGMAPISRVYRMDHLLRGRARHVRSFSSGATANLYCPSVEACAAAEEALRKVEGLEIFRKDRLPPSLRYRLQDRTGDLVAIAPAGSYFADRPGSRPLPRGMHGFRPERDDTQGMFHAWGAGVRRGARRDRLRAVDVAPLICRLLGIEAAEGSEGEVPEDLLSAPTPVPKGSGTRPDRASPPGDGTARP
jgi:alkaline phosphatase D